VRPYDVKLGLVEGENQIFLRVVDGDWQVKLVHRSPPDVTADLADHPELGGAMATAGFAAQRHPHPGFPIPGTLRWRWLADDETIWVRCDDGCCQVQQHGE
jgi:hypothetical protein